MSTNSIIAMKDKNGKYKGIYAHWDGYPNYMYTLLVEQYSNPSKVTKLINLGACSTIASVVDNKEASIYREYVKSHPNFLKSHGVPATTKVYGTTDSIPTVNAEKHITAAYVRDKNHPVDSNSIPHCYKNAEKYLKQYTSCDYMYIFDVMTQQWSALQRKGDSIVPISEAELKSGFTQWRKEYFGCGAILPRLPVK